MGRSFEVIKYHCPSVGFSAAMALVRSAMTGLIFRLQKRPFFRITTYGSKPATTPPYRSVHNLIISVQNPTEFRAKSRAIRSNK